MADGESEYRRRARQVIALNDKKRKALLDQLDDEDCIFLEMEMSIIRGDAINQTLENHRPNKMDVYERYAIKMTENRYKFICTKCNRFGRVKSAYEGNFAYPGSIAVACQSCGHAVTFMPCVACGHPVGEIKHPDSRRYTLMTAVCPNGHQNRWSDD